MCGISQEVARGVCTDFSCNRLLTIIATEIRHTSVSSTLYWIAIFYIFPSYHEDFRCWLSSRKFLLNCCESIGAYRGSLSKKIIYEAPLYKSGMFFPIEISLGDSLLEVSGELLLSEAFDVWEREKEGINRERKATHRSRHESAKLGRHLWQWRTESVWKSGLKRLPIDW